MKVINIEKAFQHAEDGISVVDYEVGEQVVSDRCAEVAGNHLKVAKLSKKTPEDLAAAEEKDDKDNKK